MFTDYSREGFALEVITSSGFQLATVTLERRPTNDEFHAIGVALRALLDAVDPPN